MFTQTLKKLVFTHSLSIFNGPSTQVFYEWKTSRHANSGHARIYNEIGLKVLSSIFATSIFVEKSRVFGIVTHYFLRCCRSTGYILHILSRHLDENFG